MTLRYFMMKIRNFVFGIALICAICFTSCSDGSSSSESNDTSSRVLDLRIKKNGVVHNSSRSIENAAEITQTAHVKATAVSGGIQFEIKLPSDATYLEIRRLEDIEGMEDFWTTRCEPQNILEYAGKTYTFVYPLCEPGEKYKFNIGMETTTINNVTTTLPEEIIIITATDGIGDIDYSNLTSRHIDLSYDGTKPTVKVSNVIPPEGDNVETRISYYAKNSSTETDWNNDAIWFGNYFGKKSDTVSSSKLYNAKDYTNPNSPVYYEEDSKILTSEDGKNWKIDEEATKECQELLATGFSHFLESTKKTYLFAQYAYTFEVNEMENPERYVWRTAILDSDIIKVK